MAIFKVEDGTGFQLNYEVIENILPETTLFVHGNLASARWWYPSAEILKTKAQGKNLKGHMILVDFRGCGLSSAPKNENEVNMHTFANDFISLVKANNWGKINLVGHSTGGLIIAMMLAKATDLFHRAVCLDPVGPSGVTFDNAMIAAFEAMKVDKNLVATVLGSTIYNNDPNAEFFKNIVVEDAFKAVKSVGHLVLKALDGLNVCEDMKKVTNEVLVFHGEHDVLLSVDESKKLASLISKGKFETIPGHGHCTNAEDPALFVEKMSQFLYK